MGRVRGLLRGDYRSEALVARTFTPLRYPGGKAALANYVKALLARNDLVGCEYVEPYCGGAGVAMELLRLELVSSIRINDVDPAIASFWRTLLRDPETLCRRVSNARLSIRQWKRHRDVLRNCEDHDEADVGFAAFYLNRVNRSGILTAGPIGGMEQTGAWLMDARFNRSALIETLEAIAAFRARIKIHSEDAVTFLKRAIKWSPVSTFCYLDPPYVVQGKRLYQNFYTEADHAKVAAAVTSLPFPWIVSYDNVALIRKLYRPYRSLSYGIRYSANKHDTGGEIMIFCDALDLPPIDSPVKITDRQWRRLAVAA